jgi:hypothetical protein
MTQNVVRRPSAAGPVFLWGLAFGGIFSIIDLLLAFIQVPVADSLGQSFGVSRFTALQSASQIAFWFFNPLALGLCFLAGLLTARRTHGVLSGAIDGLIARLLPGLVGLVLTSISLVSLASRVGRSIGFERVALTLLVLDLITLVVATAVCAGVAARGALIGRGSSTSRPMAPNALYPPAPVYAPPAGYAPPYPLYPLYPLAAGSRPPRAPPAQQM